MINYKDLNLTEEELDELQNQLNNRKKQEAYNNNLEAIENHKKYIGKCYKDEKENTYIRVLSSKSSNQYRFECMCFKFPVSYYENHHLTKIFSPDNAFSTIDFDSIYIEDYPLLCSSWKSKTPAKVINTLIEISEEEYFEKMNEYIAELQQKIKDGYFDTTKKEEY